MSHEEVSDIIGRVWNLFVDVDGARCRKICPLPHRQRGNIEVDPTIVEQYDGYSCWDRFKEVEHQLSTEESGLLLALLRHVSGTRNLSQSSLWDVVRSHALFAYDAANFDDVWFKYKLREGQSTLARKLFDDAVASGLDYSHSSPIASITDRSHNGGQASIGFVELGLEQAQRSLRARRVICTVPLNVLHDVEFSPPISALRLEAISLGHVNRLVKLHAEVHGSGLASWNGVRDPSLLMFGYGDGVLPNGNAHIVAFGDDQDGSFVPEWEPEKAVEGFKRLHEMEVRRLVGNGRPGSRCLSAHKAFRSSTTGTRMLTRQRGPHGCHRDS